jgi:hypothetical protein
MSRRLIFAFGVRLMCQPMLWLVGIVMIAIGVGDGWDCGISVAVQRTECHRIQGGTKMANGRQISSHLIGRDWLSH